MQFDFTLAANQSTTLDVSGRFFKYKSGTGVIRVRASAGGYVDLLPGQGVWNVQFSSLTVTDKSGAANAGVVLAGEFDFRDDRIVGTVDVVDGGKTKTNAGIAFSGGVQSGAPAGNYAVCQLWNPAGSGKNVIVSKAFISTDITSVLLMGVGNAVNGATLGNPANKLASGLTSSARNCYDYLPGNPAGFKTLAYVSLMANTPFLYHFAEPVILQPGYGISARMGAMAGTLNAAFEFVEETA